MCCLLSALTVQVFLYVAMANSPRVVSGTIQPGSTSVPHVNVKISDPTSMFGCSFDVTKVIFQTVVGRHSNGTQVVFERNWVSDASAELALKRLPDPFSVTNIRKCADVIVEAGYYAFEFSNGSCTAVSVVDTLCCEDKSGLHVYISQQLDIYSLDTTPDIDNNAEMAIGRLLPLLFDISKIPDVELVSTDTSSPSFWNAIIKDVDEKAYDVPLQFLDVKHCLNGSFCGPVALYNRNSVQNETDVFYLYDYCGGSLPSPLSEGGVMFSHRGFGCEYMPSELEEKECVVEFTLAPECRECAIRPYFPIGKNENACDGLNVTLVSEDEDLCLDKKIPLSSLANYTLRIFSTESNRLGFVTGPLFNAEG